MFIIVIRTNFDIDSIAFVFTMNPDRMNSHELKENSQSFHNEYDDIIKCLVGLETMIQLPLTNTHFTKYVNESSFKDFM